MPLLSLGGLLLLVTDVRDSWLFSREVGLWDPDQLRLELRDGKSWVNDPPNSLPVSSELSRLSASPDSPAAQN